MADRLLTMSCWAWRKNCRCSKRRVTATTGPEFGTCCLGSEEQLVGWICCFFDIVVAEVIEEFPQSLLFPVRNLQADQDPAEFPSLIAIVKQRNVPAFSHISQKIRQGAGSFWKPETEQPFMVGLGGTTADHIAQVGFGQFVIGQVNGLIAGLGKVVHQMATIGTFADGQADKQFCLATLGQAVIELSD